MKYQIYGVQPVYGDRGNLQVLNNIPEITKNWIHVSLSKDCKYLLPDGAVLTILIGNAVLHSPNDGNIVLSNRDFLVTQSYGLLIETCNNFKGDLIYPKPNELHSL